MENSFISKPDLRKLLMYGTIATLTICAIAGIVAIFLEVETVPLNLISTLLIFYLITFLSARCLALVNDKSIAVRSLAIVSLIMNICWGLPWILLVWDAFGGTGKATRILIWQLLWTAGVIAITCMVIAHCLAGMQNMDRRKKLLNSLPISIIGFAAIDFLVVIWADRVSDVFWKFFLSEVILVILQTVVTQILTTDAKRRQREVEDAEKQKKDAELREMWAKNMQEQEQEKKD